MPFANIPAISRRAFALSMAGAGVSLLRSAAPEAHWALLSDTHIPVDPANAYRGFKPVEGVKKVVPEVLAANPQGALICGDFARLEGLTADYEAAKSLMQPVMDKMPLAVAMGNHDDRKNFLGVFGASQNGAQAVNQKHVLVIETATARLVLLDSLVKANSTPGFLGKAQRTWLAEHLQGSSDLPTILFVHHTLSDDDGALLDAPRLFDLVKPHRKVKAIVYGHSHRYGYEVWEGIHLINLPAVAYNFTDDQPLGWVEARLTKEGGAFTLHAFAGNTEQNGRTVKVTWRS